MGFMRKTKTGSSEVDFDTRLSLAGIEADARQAIAGERIDARLTSYDYVREANRSVRTGIRDAARHSEEARRLEKARKQAPTHRSGSVSHIDSGDPNPILKRAAELIDKHGWTQGKWNNKTGAICVHQAIKMAARGNRRDEQQATAILLDRIRDEFNDSGSSVSGWNDKRNRTQEEVMRILY